MINYILIPIISAFIGYLTNVVAIKLLFWPQKPINLLGFKLQGLLPKRQADIAVSVGELVEQQLLSMDDLINQIDTPQMHERITGRISQVLKEKLYSIVPSIVPGRITQLIVDNLDKMFRQEAPELIKQGISSGRDYLTQEIQVKKLVEDKINEFELGELEEMVRGVSSTELRFIEILGGVLGLLIGLVQVAILVLFPF